ncbi:uncharacterized protein LOC133801576 [Humulus lupulus]|uniref:uncharacterized protein LOC133801576 n=1 Tax=Humulus lupulus TaxID=3486 RepID=UPI002B4044C6|nr:uncharacterized protein LOC133801576 [Humulus lupulus]
MRITSKLRDALSFASGPEFWIMAVFWTWFLLVSYLKSLLLPNSRRYTRSSPQTASSSPPFRPLCIVTGATSGLGASAALALSKEGFFVVLVGRSSQLLAETMREIKARNNHAHLNSFQVDLSSFLSILKFKASLEQWLLNSDMHSSVQLLVNNAGILATSHRLTVEGYDEIMATNYIGSFCLTKLLLPLLKNSPIPSRVVNVTSFTHRNVSSVQVNKDVVAGKCFSGLKQYPCARVYEFSKLCLLLFSYELHRQLASRDESCQISVLAADPGAVKTNLMREVPSCISHVAFVVLNLLGLLQSPENGISSILDAALAPPEISGVYFFGGKGRTIKSSKLSYNDRLAHELWTTSSDLFLQSQLATKETFT